MIIRVLGASGSDTPGHHLTSFLLDGGILFDAGGVTNSLTIEEQLKIEHIFITHAHLDHIRDIPFLADNLILSQSKSQIRIFSIEEVIDDIKKHLLNQRLWPDFTIIPNESQSVLKLEKIEEGKPVRVRNYEITPYRVAHTVTAVGFLVQGNQKSLFYTGDTGPTDKTWSSLPEIQLDGLIIEVSFPNRMSQIAKLTGHLSPELLLIELEKLSRAPKRIFITHLKSIFRDEIIRELESLNIPNMSILFGAEVIEL